MEQRVESRFSQVRFLNDDIADQVVKRVTRHICDNGMPGLPVGRQDSRVKEAIFMYLSELTVQSHDIEMVESEDTCGLWSSARKGQLLLMRGLLACGVLKFALGSKRWRVNYGLDPNRVPPTRLAVPFKAKDCPTLRSEYSHPDVVIVLTSLSYYYKGLCDDELFATMRCLIKSDQAHVEYAEWVQSSSLPDAFRQLEGVNITDEFQCKSKVFPHLRFIKEAIDFYLARLVFPKELKEFPSKISASGWDLAEVRANPTTGFSGTNDTRHVLPLSITQLDLWDQKHTNALMISYLLQDENSVELLSSMTHGVGHSQASQADLILATVMKMTPETRVILDVGAQILEYTNLEMATRWLAEYDPASAIKAAIFFDDQDELCVIDHNGRVESFQTSPFAAQPDVCIVFLDEVHTRGTDLKLPDNYRAAVTLGPNLTKDRLAQACMRMRKLGKGQSVVFCIPEEIQNKIAQCAMKEIPQIDTSDVIYWVVQGTFAELRRSMPLWATQGIRYQHQKELWDAARTPDGFDFAPQELKKFLEEEAQSLESRYRPNLKSNQSVLTQNYPTGSSLSLIQKRCQEFCIQDLSETTLQEEQERELAPEIEQERQIERPAPAKPRDHSLHQDLVAFAKTGMLNRRSSVFVPAFKSLQFTSAAKHLDLTSIMASILVTQDFTSTVKSGDHRSSLDQYQRPVQWILTSAQADTMENLVIISPYEANELTSIIRQYNAVTLHLYAPRLNIQYAQLDYLNLYNIGKPFNESQINWKLIVELNLFAGQLYFASFAEYTEVCEYLGLAWENMGDEIQISADGFIMTNNTSAFRSSPVKFFQILLSKVRRNCEGIEKTQLGRLLNGELLEEQIWEDES